MDSRLEELAKIAWSYRERALLFGRTRVGAAALSSDGTIYGGCNIQHRFRSHDLHAEVTALAAMVCAGCSTLTAIIVVSEFPGLRPCGNCLDWILQLGGDNCVVAWQDARGSGIERRRASELMPLHPPYGQASHGSP